MISKKKFKKLADKHLTAIERPRNEFGRNEIKIYGLDELYEAINYTHCCKSDSEQFSFADMRDAFDYASVSRQRRDGYTFKEWISKR